jgi:hypothetical protein
MKLKEWGYLRHRPRKATGDRNNREDGNGNDSDGSETMTGTESQGSLATVTATTTVEPEGNVMLLEAEQE